MKIRFLRNVDLLVMVDGCINEYHYIKHDEMEVSDVVSNPHAADQWHVTFFDGSLACVQKEDLEVVK